MKREVAWCTCPVWVPCECGEAAAVRESSVTMTGLAVDEPEGLEWEKRASA